MHVLMIFCDMVRANRLSTFNSAIPNDTALDSWFHKLGGTAFTSCYTPAPDTPRSLGCLYTGRYPKNNGCRTRLQWPRYYLNKTADTFFDLVQRNEFELHGLLSEERLNVGLLPDGVQDRMHIHSTMADVVKAKKQILTPSSLLFLDLPDYHLCVDDYASHDVAHEQGTSHLANSFEEFFSDFDPDDFDYVFIFSDHGCKLGREGADHQLKFLNDDRSKVVMFVRQKNAHGIEHVDSLTSIMDIYPTLSQLLEPKKKEDSDGISLFSPQEGRLVVLEDQSSFAPSIGGYHDLWGVRSSENFYIQSLSDSILFKVNAVGGYDEIEKPLPCLIQQFTGALEEHACSYVDNLKQVKILNYYHKLKARRGHYSDGRKRPHRYVTLVFRVLMKFMRTVWSILR